MVSLAQAKTDAKREGWAEWIRSEADERAIVAGCWFDLPTALAWCEFIETNLVFTRGPQIGKPYRLLDWQRNNFVMPLFGWKRDKNRRHLRRYRKGDFFIGKKQGKSTCAGAICDAFLAQGPARTEVYGVAHATEQAGIIYREAAAFARRSSTLSKLLKPLDSQKRILFEAKGSFYQALAGENGARSAEGIIPSLILFDEIHVQRDRVLYDALAYACLATENSLFLSVSTVGVADPTQIWWEQYEYAKGIVEGKEPYVDDYERFAFIAQADEACKDSAELRADPAQWKKAMPALGVTVTEESVAAAVREAENSPAKQNNLLRYVFNIPTAQIERVIPMDQWQACAWRAEDGPFPDLTGRACIMAGDFASHEDLTSIALFFPAIDETTKGYLRTFFWCPEEKILERERKQLAHYGVWSRQGHLQSTPGARIEHPLIVAQIREWLKQYRVTEFLFDPWGAEAIVNAVQHEVACVQVQQGPVGMAGFCKAFLDAIASGAFYHDGNPVMDWCCSNAAAESRPDVVWFSKKKSAEKIDGVIAAAMGVGRGMTTTQPDVPQLIVF